jgi:outer membrane protein TolC
MAPINGPVSLEEAIARALKYNLEHRTRLIQQVLASDNLQAGHFDMLPRLLANAGYATRDNDATRRSLNPSTGTISEIGYVSSDRAHVTGDISLMWNVLDFGASYYTSTQNADQLLIANERRRKAMHILIQNVRTAYWRALAAQMIGPRLKSSIAQGEAALADAQKVTAERVKNPTESLRYRRLLLENLRLLEGVERELSSARIELNNLIGLSPGLPIQLAETELIPPPLNMPITLMEEVALRQNADLRESLYNTRIAASETRKSLLKMLPGISFDYGRKYDGDSYLINQQWHEAGLRVSFNLFNLLSGPSRLRAAESNEKVEESRRMALQMSVLTQVHLASHQHEDALRQYQRADAIYLVDAEMARIVNSQMQGNVVSRLDMISAEVTHILSAVRRYQAIAKVHESASRVQATLGLEPEIASLDDTDLITLQGLIKKSLRQWATAK